MSESLNTDVPSSQAERDEMNSALFAHLIMQQSNMAMLLLGKVPHPETGKTTQDLEAARLFIDMLEMLEAKTKGNLSKEEVVSLKQNLMSLRMAFVEAVNTGSPASTAQADAPKEPAPANTESPSEESHKKFSKKY